MATELSREEVMDALWNRLVDEVAERENQRPPTYTQEDVLLMCGAYFEAGQKFATSESHPAVCLDCGLLYAGFGVDITLSDAHWLLICPEKDGLLCGTCIARRARQHGSVVAIRAELELF